MGNYCAQMGNSSKDRQISGFLDNSEILWDEHLPGAGEKRQSYLNCALIGAQMSDGTKNVDQTHQRMP